MLSKTNDDDSSGSSDYVLLAAEEAEEETTVSELSVPETEPLLAPPESVQDLVEEASDLILEQFVDEPETEVNEDDASKDNASESGDDDAGGEEESINNHAEEEPELGISSDDVESEKEADEVNVKNEDLYDDAKELNDTPADDAKKEEEVSDVPEGVPADDASHSSDEELDPKKAEESKENHAPAKTKGTVPIGEREYKFGTRREVNGAAAFFGIAGLIIGGPVLGLVLGAASAHIAANKPCKCANLTRSCGGAVGVGYKDKKPRPWDKITDRLVEGGEWTERKFSPPRRIKPHGRTYPATRKSAVRTK